MPLESADGVAVLFDWDGVVIDSHDYHKRAWFALAEEMGKPMTAELFDKSFGMRNESIIPGLFAWAEPGDLAAIQAIGDRKEVLYRECLRQSGIEPLSGVRELLAGLREAGIKCSVGSSTPRANIEACLELTGLAESFDAVSASEDVTRGKPAPDIFLKAAAKVNCDPSQCVVIEDAHVGIEAALQAGMKAIAVTTSHPRASFVGAVTPHRIIDSLKEIGAVDIRALLR